MASGSLEKRVAQLERRVVELQNELTESTAKLGKDWRRTIGMFTDDAGMKEILEEARKLREADRRKARPVAKKRRRPTR